EHAGQGYGAADVDNARRAGRSHVRRAHGRRDRALPGSGRLRPSCARDAGARAHGDAGLHGGRPVGGEERGRLTAAGRGTTDSSRRVARSLDHRRVGMPISGRVGVDWQKRVTGVRFRGYRLERAGERMRAHGRGALLLMYDENVRYVTSTLTPGWNRLKPGLRYALLC